MSDAEGLEQRERKQVLVVYLMAARQGPFGLLFLVFVRPHSSSGGCHSFNQLRLWNLLADTVLCMHKRSVRQTQPKAKSSVTLQSPGS
jgi:hypothetical protein